MPITSAWINIGRTIRRKRNRLKDRSLHGPSRFVDGVREYIDIYIYILCMHLSICMYVCIYVCMYVCKHVCVSVNLHVCMYVYTRAHTPPHICHHTINTSTLQLLKILSKFIWIIQSTVIAANEKESCCCLESICKVYIYKHSWSTMTFFRISWWLNGWDLSLTNIKESSLP